MIFALSGILIARQGLQLIIDVAGVGYGVLTSMNTLLTLPNLGSKVLLHTHLICREDSQVLYGFVTEAEKILFIELIKVSGLGGKLALAILSHLSVDEFIKVVQSKELISLTKIPGVGQKIAQRLIIEIQSNWQGKKFAKLFPFNIASNTSGITSSMVIPTDPVDELTHDVTEGLIALGYKPKEAQIAVNKVMNDGTEHSVTRSREHLLKAALKFLAKV